MKEVEPSAAENFAHFATDWDKQFTLWKRQSSQDAGKEYFETRTYTMCSLTFSASANSFIHLHP